MNRSGSRNWRAIGSAALVGAAIAFPAGLFVGVNRAPGDDPQASSRRAPAPAGTPVYRDVYSPRIAGDPYVLEQQRRVLRALEVSCTRLKQHCVEAEEARRRIDEAEAHR